MKRPIVWLLAAAAAMLGLAALIGLWILPQFGGGVWYVQIDNSLIETGGPRSGVIDMRGGMDYYYTLPACNEQGQQREIEFGTSRQLREGAFLRLTVSPLRGVTEWSEAAYDELPAAVQSHFSAPAEG